MLDMEAFNKMAALVKALPPAPAKVELNSLGMDRLSTIAAAPVENHACLNGLPCSYDPALDANRIPVFVVTYTDGRRRKFSMTGER